MTINLSGELIDDEWAELYRHYGFGIGFYCPLDIRNAINNLPAGEELVLEINSVGGNVDAASEIYALLQKCSNPTRAEIQSLAASAASYLCLACDRVEIALTAQMMVHRSSAWMAGNCADMQWAADMLHVTDEAILGAYCAKCGEGKREKLRELMEKETFLNAADALELGLVDAIIGAADQNEPQQITASVHNNIVRAMRTLPSIDELRQRRDDEQRAELEKIKAAKMRYQKMEV